MDVAVSTGETAVRPLTAEQLYRPTDLSGLTFSTTAELQPVDGLVGQARAVEAIRFGTQVGKTGFNLFVIGPDGARMQDAVKAMLAAAAGKPGPSDWVYVNNFADPDKPIAIELPAGRARNFHDAMHKLIDDLKSALPAVFQGEDYQRRQAAIDESFQKRQGEAFSALRDKAAEEDIAILRTPLGFALAQSTFLAASTTHRAAGGLAVGQLLEGNGLIMMKDGKPIGQDASGKAVIRLASGTFAALSGKTLKWISKPTGPNRFEQEYSE